MKLTKIAVEPPPPPPATFRLEMNLQEATYLASILGKIGGKGPLRDFVSSVYHALDNAGAGSDYDNPVGLLTAH